MKEPLSTQIDKVFKIPGDQRVNRRNGCDTNVSRVVAESRGHDARRNIGLGQPQALWGFRQHPRLRFPQHSLQGRPEAHRRVGDLVKDDVGDIETIPTLLCRSEKHFRPLDPARRFQIKAGSEYRGVHIKTHLLAILCNTAKPSKGCESEMKTQSPGIRIGPEITLNPVSKRMATSKKIPRVQRFANRPKLGHMLLSRKDASRFRRDKTIRDAHFEYGYSLAEIARHLGLHYTTISKIVNAQN